jgi:quercetin dioxygenase-like cupin family protein
MGPSARVTFVAPGAVTNRDFGLFRWDMRPQAGGASPHFHKTFSESFYILTGSVFIFNGERWIRASAGDFVYVPVGGVHGFSNNDDAPASMLILFSPGLARENFFSEIADVAASRRQLSQEEWDELYARHDQYMVY